jgi:hypothetical protein
VTDETVPKPYRVEIPVAVGRDEAWEAVTQPPVLRQWFGWDYDGLDAKIRHIFVDEAMFLAPERMGWADGSFLEVTGDDDSCTVRAVRGGPPGDTDRYDAIEEGWKAFLVQLRYLLEQRPKGRRRTLYLTGTSTGRQALRLADTAWTRLGARVAWTVDADGHLVVVAGREHLHSPYAGRIEVTVSTFGLNDAAFDDYRERWTRRWAPLARDADVTYGHAPAPSF